MNIAPFETRDPELEAGGETWSELVDSVATCRNSEFAARLDRESTVLREVAEFVAVPGGMTIVSGLHPALPTNLTFAHYRCAACNSYASG